MSKKGKDTSKKTLPPPQTIKGRALWIGLVIFACGWMFVLGIFVGRGTAPVRFDVEALQKELASLKEAVIKKDQLRFKIDSDAVKHKTDMGFYESLKTSEGDVEKKDSRANVASGTNRKPLRKPAAFGRENNGVSKKVIAAESARNDPAPEISSEAGTEKRITVQVAAVKDPELADRMVARLKDKWYPAYKTMADVPGKGVWYRVRIGSFKRKAEAQSTLERLKKDDIDAVLLPQ